ncbi:Yip1 domain protein [Ichthyophthirius multifiliis]|uniref:Yip1 domain protein n=1 Tax=Ichthyophthirius multifiliis TaxID=5932 RepID=G0R3U2_ICHMU|nr:Yip1 domain protein [Ichthyophthirius multifiliis]EGR27849.1 Yip1 domain protein [Ichthyophthirius multifiliis]|eukprot:XP_004027194.1 Yip1 domain protein [Ichthyophthirius multifiliis]
MDYQQENEGNNQVLYGADQDIETVKEDEIQKPQEKMNKEEQQQFQKSCCAILSVEYYQPYFNITSNEIIKRIKCCFVPTKPEFLNIIKQNPDLWGPFWILTTVVFMLYSCGNLSQYIQMICLYGYSMACFVIVTLMNMIPLYYIKVISVIYGLLSSTVFIVINIFGDIKELAPQKKYIILGIIGVFQVGVMLTFLLYFFS